MSVSGLGSYFQNLSSKVSVSSGTFASPLQPKDGKEGGSAKAEFLEEATKTPAERIQDAVRKRLGISEEEFEKMDASQRSAVESAVREMIQEQVAQGNDRGVGHFADVTA